MKRPTRKVRGRFPALIGVSSVVLLLPIIVFVVVVIFVLYSQVLSEAILKDFRRRVAKIIMIMNDV